MEEQELLRLARKEVISIVTMLRKEGINPSVIAEALTVAEEDILEEIEEEIASEKEKKIESNKTFRGIPTPYKTTHLSKKSKTARSRKIDQKRRDIWRLLS